MPKKRGRPRKVLPTHPNKVISIAMRRGLSAALELQRDIKNRETVGLYQSSRELFSDAMDAYYLTVRAGKADHSKIVQVENNVRRNVLDMCWENAAAYGNTEVKRVKRADETIGPLNQRFNICGANLRNFGMTMFPFQEPEFFGYQTRKVDGQPTTFRLMGYGRDSYGPHTALVHPDLPSMDFVDTIRHHLDYLATFCYRYDVPPRETGRYWNLYQLRARPYLEHIYTECSSGKNRFREGTRRILQEIKEDIEKHYSVRSGDEPTVTGTLETFEPSFSTDFFSDIIVEARSRRIDDPALDELERLHTSYLPYEVDKEDDDSSKKTYLREKDVQDIHKRISKRSTKKGSQVHRTISSQLNSPWNLRNIIIDGESLGNDDKYLISFEVPVDTSLGKGQMDILLSERVSHNNETQVFQRPLMVLEIKTKLGHSMTLGRKDIQSESRAHYGLDQRVVPDFRFDDRTFDSVEWEKFISATPTPNSQTQLNAYSEAIWNEYQRLTGSEEPNALTTGVVLVEGTEDIRLVRDMMESLVTCIYEELTNHKDHGHRLVFEPKVKGKSLGVAVIINKRPETVAVEGTPIEPDWRPTYDPLQLISTHTFRFILYLSDGKSPVSSGESAGWIAKFYHGLHLIKEIRESTTPKDVVWLDLADQFVNPMLAEARLYLRPYSKSDNDIWRSQSKDIQQLFESIRVVGLLDEVDGVMFRNEPVTKLRAQLSKLSKKDCLIVVSGMDTIRDATPEFHRWRLELLLSEIVSGLPDNRSVSVIWFDSPFPGETFSTAYSRRTLLPFYESSILNGIVNEVVWNLPVVPGYEADPNNWPLPTIARTPYHDDIRIIIKQDCDGFSIESTLVPILTSWSKRFRAEGLGEVTSEIDVDQIVPDASIRARMEILALTLLPWIVKLWAEQKLDADHEFTTVRQRYDQETSKYLIEKEHTSLESRTLESEIGNEPTLLQRVRFRPEQTIGGRSFVPVTLNTINSQRLYRRPRRIRTKPIKLSGSQSLKEKASLTALSDIRFGLILSSSRIDYQWRVVVNPSVSSPLKIGLFKLEENKIGLEWSVSRLDIVSELGRQLRQFDGRVIEFLFRRNPEYNDDTQDESKWFAWKRTEGEANWVPAGLHNHVLRSSESKTSLRAFGLQPDCDISDISVPDVEFPVELREIVHQTIERISRQLSGVKHVALKLETIGKEFNLQFLDPQSGEKVESLKMRNTADLIGLLRWPMTEGRPLRLRRDLLVAWEPFHDFSRPSPDIDFGEDLKSLEGQLISLTESEGMVLSPSIVDTAHKHRKLQITIRHYPDQCPLVRDARLDHDSCWGFDPLSEDQFLDFVDTEHYLTDQEILECVKRLVQSIGNRRLVIVFDHGPDKDDRLVFNESEVMRELSREYRGIPLQTFAPGHTSRIKLRKKTASG